MAWVKSYKEIRGNEEADRLSKEASILGHKSEGVVTSDGLRAWSKRVRGAKVREERGEEILGWHCRAVSAYTWCVTDKLAGP